MSVMQSGITFLEFANLPESQRDEFLGRHPEILDTNVVGWALMAARMREPADRRRIASAALYIATELGSNEQVSAARQLLAEV